jgi:formamidopyrimidine-DNA glycosylase
MPELPEVETTRRGIRGAVRGQRVRDVRRRAKYLIIDLESGSLIVHLGMSGSLRVLDTATPLDSHDHYDLLLDSGRCLRFNDPRRFGSLHWSEGDPSAHPLLAALGPEPLTAAFNADYLARRARGRRVAIKQFVMDQRIVVGVGNIYASEALFRAGVHPKRAAGRVSDARMAAIVEAVGHVLGAAIRAGGTTLRDYVGADGAPGYFRQRLYVYERAGRPCRRCRTPVRHLVQGQRSTYYCPRCQR